MVQYVEEHGTRLDEEQVKRLMRQILAGYKDLHSKGILHRNIKPSNIFIFKDTINLKAGNRVIAKLGDFGFSQKRHLDKELYTAPETLLDDSRATAASDVWSIGAMALYMLQGSPPFTSTGDALIDDMRQCKYAVNVELTRYCIEFICMCLEFEPRKRMTYESMISHPFIMENNERWRAVDIIRCSFGNKNRPKPNKILIIQRDCFKDNTGKYSEAAAPLNTLSHAEENKNEETKKVVKEQHDAANVAKKKINIKLIADADDHLKKDKQKSIPEQKKTPSGNIRNNR
eukprot:TRINITY_DN2183_c0_g9_i1.p1 TRINITY_DN2183_c0_g9~~TRINITY_DN2183_c0_g9_i1.p1  ORF type:complete len:299 (+),score=51.53 TRINITY_DN2183_c0_g9_i1:37-897(+)